MPPNRHTDRIRAVRFVYGAGDTTGEHHHDEHQLVYASSGLLCVDTAESRWVLPPLRAVWVPAHTLHTVTANADSEMSTLYLRSDLSVSDFNAVTVVSVSPLLRELIHHILRDSPTGLVRDRLEAVILDQLTVAPTAPLELRQLSDPRLQAIAEILETNPADQRTLRQLGDEVGANERTLQRLFHREIGTTFGRWRTQLRLQDAIITLGRGHTVTTAATNAGYNEPSAFIAAFRNTFGTTPGRYFTSTESAVAR
jgi:AraC-like DNA-binding protein